MSDRCKMCGQPMRVSVGADDNGVMHYKGHVTGSPSCYTFMITRVEELDKKLIAEQAERFRLKARVEELEGVLQSIADIDPRCANANDHRGVDSCDFMIAKARAALAVKGGE